MVIEYPYDVDLDKIAKSGQCFRLRRNGMYYQYGPCVVMQLGPKKLWVEDCVESVFIQTLDYSHIESLMQSRGGYLERCALAGHGLLILNQPLFETVISFIISQNNNIKRIEGIIDKLCGGPGRPFPLRDELLNLNINDWENLGVGYRAGYLYKAVRICDNVFLSNLKTCEATSKQLGLLQTIPGVGPKVANCIALFALKAYGAFPEDVWIKRIVNTEFNGYFDLSWCRDFAGIVQQYMFYYGRII